MRRALVAVLLVATACGSSAESDRADIVVFVDVDAGLAAFYESTDQTAADIADICDDDEPDICGEDLIEDSIRRQCEWRGDSIDDLIAVQLYRSVPSVWETTKAEMRAACPAALGSVLAGLDYMEDDPDR